MQGKIAVKPLIISLLIPLGVGSLSSFLTRNATDVYDALPSPPLSPPDWLFAVVWNILFILMGISAYLIWQSDCPNKKKALTIYGVQLAVNFVWPLLFFNANMLFGAILWIFFLIALVAVMIYQFYQCKPLAGLLQIPYLLWLLFATYLNIAIYALSQ